MRGDANARGETESALRTARAACSSPRERDDRAEARGGGGAGRAHGVEQVRRAVGAGRRRRPDRAGEHDRRVAAVQRSHSTAVSSSVSVPWVTTTPRPDAASATAARAMSSASAALTWTPGQSPSVRARRPGTPASAGTAATSAAASSAGRRRAPAIAIGRPRRAPSPRRAAAMADPTAVEARAHRARTQDRCARPLEVPRRAANRRAVAHARCYLSGLQVPTPRPSGALSLPPRPRPTEPVGLYDPAIRARRLRRRVRRAAERRAEPRDGPAGDHRPREPRAPRRRGRRPEHGRRRGDAAADARRAAARR